MAKYNIIKNSYPVIQFEAARIPKNPTNAKVLNDTSPLDIFESSEYRISFNKKIVTVEFLISREEFLEKHCGQLWITCDDNSNVNKPSVLCSYGWKIKPQL